MTTADVLGLVAATLAATLAGLAAERILLRYGVAAPARLASAGGSAATVLLVIFAGVAAYR